MPRKLTGRPNGRPRADHTGKRYGKLTGVAYAGRRGTNTLWLWRCECGNEKVMPTANVVYSERGCGQCPKPAPPPKVYEREQHGMTRTRTYRSWSHMKERCYNPNALNFDKYGGRGITVCQAWRDSFLAFLADMGSRPRGRSLDRIDPNGNYEPSNCRWATYTEQSYNQRRRA